MKEISLETEDVVVLTRIGDVDEVVGDGCSIDDVVGKVFARTDVHATIHLTAVGTDDFGVEPCGQVSGKGGLATSRRS